MTDAELYRLIMTVALITGIVFLAVSVLLFFRLKIMKVIRDLTGRSAKYGIKKSKEEVKKRKEQEMAFAQQHQTRAGKKNTGKLKGKVGKTEEISEETTILENNETTVLQNEDTVVLEPAMNENFQHTEVLAENDTERLGEPAAKKPAADMVIEDDITVVNTDVIIK